MDPYTALRPRQVHVLFATMDALCSLNGEQATLLCLAIWCVGLTIAVLKVWQRIHVVAPSKLRRSVPVSSPVTLTRVQRRRRAQRDKAKANSKVKTTVASNYGIKVRDATSSLLSLTETRQNSSLLFDPDAKRADVRSAAEQVLSTVQLVQYLFEWFDIAEWSNMARITRTARRASRSSDHLAEVCVARFQAWEKRYQATLKSLQISTSLGYLGGTKFDTLLERDMMSNQLDPPSFIVGLAFRYANSARRDHDTAIAQRRQWYQSAASVASSMTANSTR
jgi:hypothetical protein